MSSKCKSNDELRNFFVKNVSNGYQLYITAGDEFNFHELDEVLKSEELSKNVKVDDDFNFSSISDIPVLYGRTEKVVELLVEMNDHLLVCMVSYSDEMLKEMTLKDEDFNRKVSQSRSYNETYSKVKEAIALRNMTRRKETKLAHIVLDFQVEKKRREDEVSDLKIQDQSKDTDQNNDSNNRNDNELEGVD